MLRTLFQTMARRRSKVVASRILPFIDRAKKIIDIGSGTGDVTFLLKQMGKDVVPVDVSDFHGPRLVKTTIYNGKELPFPDKSFDTALLLMVLHHTPNPDVVFSEASRVAKEIVVIETSFTTPISRWFTIVSDTLANLRLKAFWSSYKTDAKWREFFIKRNYKIIKTKKYHDRNFGLPFLHISYYLRGK